MLWALNSFSIWEGRRNWIILFYFISIFFQSWGRIWKRETIREEKNLLTPTMRLIVRKK